MRVSNGLGMDGAFSSSCSIAAGLTWAASAKAVGFCRGVDGAARDVVLIRAVDVVVRLYDGGGAALGISSTSISSSSSPEDTMVVGS